MLPIILLFTFIATILSLFFVSIMLLYERKIKSISFHLVSFGAGALLAAGLTDTMPEAVELSQNSFLYVTIFIATFFLIERVFLHFHHHEHDKPTSIKLPLPLLLFGDALHNFIDGISIATTFLVSFPLGVVTSIAVFVHEIPHEMGDFGILLHLGFNRSKVLGFNILTGITAFAGALLGFYFAGKIEGALPVLLSLTTANFLYLSLSDLLPEIHEKVKGKSLLHALPFFLGVVMILLLTNFLKG